MKYRRRRDAGVSGGLEDSRDDGRDRHNGLRKSIHIAREAWSTSVVGEVDTTVSYAGDYSSLFGRK